MILSTESLDYVVKGIKFILFVSRRKDMVWVGLGGYE